MYNIFNSPDPRFYRLNFKYPFSPVYKVFKAVNINTVSTHFFLSVAHMPTDYRIPIFQTKDLATAHILFLLVFFFFSFYSGIAGESDSDSSSPNSAPGCAH